MRALSGLRRLPLPGPRLRGAARAEADAGARRAPAARRDLRAAARGDRPLRARDLPLPQQARVLVHEHARRPCARLPSRRPLGRGARGRALLADRRRRQPDPRRRPRLGAGGGVGGVLAGGSERLPAPPRRPSGPQHRPGVRPARDREGRALRDRLPRRGAAPHPRGPRGPLGGQRHTCRGDEPPDPPALGRGVDRGGAVRPPLPRPAERVPADEHRHGRAPLRARRATRRS